MMVSTDVSYPYTPEQMGKFVLRTRSGDVLVSRVESDGEYHFLHFDSPGHHSEVVLIDDLGHALYNTYHWHGPGKFVIRS